MEDNKNIIVVATAGGIEIIIEDERTDEKNDFCYDGGLASFVEYLNRAHSSIHEPIIITGERDEVQVEVAIQYNDTFQEKIYSFANNINTREGGFHLSGFKGALTRTVNAYSTSDNVPENMQGMTNDAMYDKSSGYEELFCKFKGIYFSNVGGDTSNEYSTEDDVCNALKQVAGL